MSADCVLQTKALTKRFRQVTALDRLNLELHAGEVLALLGSNGSGKSTTFRLLLNIYQPTDGEAFLLGQPSRKLNGRDFDKVSYVSEGQKLPLWMTVRGFLDFCAGFYQEWDAGMCQRLVESFGLHEGQKLKFLSRGQRMKAALASVLPSRPKILLLDEPFSGLDVETRAQVSHLLRTLAQEHSLAIVLTTHDVEEVEPVATRVAILSRGELKLDEPLANYLGRHRLLQLEGASLESLPEELRALFRPMPNTPPPGWYFTDRNEPALQERLQASMSEGARASLLPMNLRQILTAHSLPVV